MRFTCRKHGEVEAEPNFNLDIYCPECVSEAAKDSLADTIPPASAKDDDVSFVWMSSSMSP